MAVNHICPECGVELPANAPQGLCPRCLANMGLDALVSPEPFLADIQVDRAGTVIGRYKLLEKIGEGGFGIVFMAEQVEPVQRKVALKIIKAGMDTREVVARFEAERQAIALMDHPNIARALDAGATEAGRPYFVMELVRGIPITEYCDQNELSTRERLGLFIKVCQAVQHAHQKGVIHRDLKPSNVLVTEHDGEPVPKVIDFGVAKALGQKLTEKTLFTAFHHLIGTPAYMSPEQAALSGIDVDTRADIYSLGVLLYELLTGVTPFDVESFRKAGLDEIRRMIRETEPPKPSTRLQTLGQRITEVAKHRQTEPATLSKLVRGDLDWIVMKCLEKDRQRRYETANGLATDVARHLDTEPIVARPPSSAYRIQKLLQRHKLALAAAGTVVGSLVIGLGLFIWQWREALEAREGAERALAQMEVQNAEEAFAEHDTSTALAYLAHALRENPRNESLAARAFSNLVQQVFVIPLAEPLVHSGTVYFAQSSPDGLRVATASDDGTARVWDTCTGKPVTPPLAHAGPVDFVQFNPRGDRVATASEDNTVRVWDANSGKPLIPPIVHPNAVGWVYFSPDGNTLITSTRRPDASARLWSATSGQLLAGPITNVHRLRCSPFSPDGKELVLQDGTNVWIRDAATGMTRIGPMRHSREVTSAEYSRDGQRILTSSYDGTSRIWDARTGWPRTEPMNHGGPLWLARFSSDGQKALSVCNDNTVQIWDADSGRAWTGPLEFVFTTHQYPPARSYGRSDTWLETKAAQFSPDGRMLVMAFLDSAQLLDANTGQVLAEPFRQEGITSAEFSRDSQCVVTASDDGSARIWGIRRADSQRWEEMLQHRTNLATPAIGPVPRWVPELLEALGGTRLNEEGVAVQAHNALLSPVRSQIPSASDANIWNRWGRWVFAGDPTPNRSSSHPARRERPALHTATSQPGATMDNPVLRLIGRSVPRNFRLPLMDGGEFELPAASQKGILLLDFWTSWCDDCQATAPLMAQIANEYSPRGVRYIAVNYREPPEAIRSFLTGLKLDIPVALDLRGAMADALGVKSIPTVVIVDEFNVVRAVHIGVSDQFDDEVRRALDDVLAK